MTAPLLACMALVAQAYALPPRVLPAIQTVEGGSPGIIHRNTDGSDDLGPMQVNTLWLPVLARAAGLPAEEVRDRLLTRPCFNVAAAGLILRTYLDETRGNLLRAIGDYHSHTPMLNLRYQGQVLRSAAALFQPPAPGGRRSARYLAMGRSGPYGPQSTGCLHCGPAQDNYRGYIWRHGYFP